MIVINDRLINLTISDLIIKSIYENNDLYLEEVRKRLYYCGFSPNVIDEVIKKELKLVVDRKNELIIPKRVIDKNFKKENIDVKKMMLGELLCLIDEAVMISKFFKDQYDSNTLQEILLISNEDMHNILFKEFYNRLEKCFRKANNLKLKFRGFVYEEQIGKLYEEEMKIILKERWSNTLEIDFTPYDGEDYE